MLTREHTVIEGEIKLKSVMSKFLMLLVLFLSETVVGGLTSTEAVTLTTIDIDVTDSSSVLQFSLSFGCQAQDPDEGWYFLSK